MLEVKGDSEENWLMVDGVYKELSKDRTQPHYIVISGASRQ